MSASVMAFGRVFLKPDQQKTLAMWLLGSLGVPESLMLTIEHEISNPNARTD